jgi:hypothetical protein
MVLLGDTFVGHENPLLQEDMGESFGRLCVNLTMRAT